MSFQFVADYSQRQGGGGVMAERSTKSLAPLGLLGLVVALVVLTIWITSPGRDVSAARRLVADLEAEGSIHNRECGPDRPNRASISRALWERWDTDGQERLVSALATLCEAQGAGLEVELLDTETGALLASYDGWSVGSQIPAAPDVH
jgi:hypothetical protein